MAGLVKSTTFEALLMDDPKEKFIYIDPPFNLNHPDIAKYPPEVTGCFLLHSFAVALDGALSVGEDFSISDVG
jgi:hypothetical protein